MHALGVDIGTNGAKALLMDENGRVLRQAYRAYGLTHPGDASVEQRADDWLDAVYETVREVGKGVGEVALSFSTQGGTTVCVDERGNALRPAITWMDNRSGEQAAAISAMRDGSAQYRVTGSLPSTGATLCHARWLREREPETFRRACRFLTTLDYVNLRLTGNAVIDPTNALMTGMLDIAAADWDAFSLAAVPLGRERLAKILPTGAPVGLLTRDAAKKLGLPEDTAVYNGAHDQYAAALGCGAVRPGDFMLSSGTAWVLLGSFERAPDDPTMTLMPGRHAIPGLYGAFYSISVGGAALNWLLDALAIERGELPRLNEIAAGRVEKNRDLFFYPYLNGSTAISRDTDARGVFAGLSLASDRYDMALAVMEGIAFETMRAVQLFESCGCAVNALRMMGGASKSDLWADILAAVTGRAVVRGAQSEAAGVGAACIAATGAGLFPTLNEASFAVLRERSERETLPNLDMRRHYERKYERYIENLAHALAFHRTQTP